MRAVPVQPFTASNGARSPSALLRTPSPKRLMRGEVGEIGVRREQLQLVTNAELRKQRVDRANLDASPARTVSDLCSLKVIVAVGCHERQGGKARDDCFMSTGSAEALEQLLIDESSRHHELACGQGSLQSAHLGEICRRIAAERKRPHARVDEEGHSRVRCCL